MLFLKKLSYCIYISVDVQIVDGIFYHTNKKYLFYLMQNVLLDIHNIAVIIQRIVPVLT